MNEPPGDDFPRQYARQWAAQLVREFEGLCFQHRLDLPVPAIEFFTAAHKLGEWQAAGQTLRLNWRLIMERPWPVTINVFKHEMAHQLCDYWGYPQVGHGPLFERACQRLGVPAAYRRASGDTPVLFDDLAAEDATLGEGRRFLAKVEKLLALGRSPNEHEAALAMRKANELIARHNLSLDADGEAPKRRYRRAVIDCGGRRIHGWQRAIGGILTNFFYVALVMANTYDPRLNERHRAIELFGRAENVAVAEYCFHFLERELARLWQLRRQTGQARGLAGKNSYYLGVLNGFRQKLQAQQQTSSLKTDGQQEMSTSALVVTGDLGLREFISQTYPRVQRYHGAGSRIDQAAYRHGEQDGGTLVLRPGVEHRAGNLGHLLPGN